MAGPLITGIQERLDNLRNLLGEEEALPEEGHPLDRRPLVRPPGSQATPRNPAFGRDVGGASGEPNDPPSSNRPGNVIRRGADDIGGGASGEVDVPPGTNKPGRVGRQ